jgi:hypothetical protein
MSRFLRQVNMPRMAVRALAVLILVAAPDRYPVNASTLTPACKVHLSFPGKVVGPPLSHSLQFANDATLAVAIVVHNPEPPRLVRPGEFGENSAFFLRAALLNANTGQILKQADWPTDYPRHSELLAAVNSKLLVLLGNRVALYSGNLELLKQLQLPGNNREVWVGRASPSGRSALFIEDAGLKPTTWAWVDANHLRVLRVWKSVPPQPGGQGTPISDGYITFMQCLPPGGRPPCSLKIRSLDGSSVRAVRGIDLHHGSPEFVADNLLLAHGWSGDISILNLVKHRVIRHLSPGFFGDNFGSAVSAPGADRFVVPVLSREFGLEYLYIFDGPSARLSVLRIRGLSSLAWRPGRFRRSSNWLALSSNGRLLAAMENYCTLLIFRLPPPK